MTIFTREQYMQWQRQLNEVSERYPSTGKSITELSAEGITPEKIVRDRMNHTIQKDIRAYRDTLRALLQTSKRTLFGKRYSGTGIRELERFLLRVSEIEKLYGPGKYFRGAMTPEEIKQVRNPESKSA